MSIYRVDKSEQPVVLFQADGSVMKGVVFLSASAYSHIGRQTLADLLREKGDFFPFRSEAGSFCVTNKATITHIRYEQITPEQEYAPLGNPVEVLVNFAGGEQLRGTVIIEMPEGRNRLFDFVNSASGFFAMRNGEALYLVNVAQIRDISPC
ncbi:MAG: hypothetical protein FIB02_00690 [Desulfuromonas sp.]|nr:hypothetical protein [Desulfuromonas sp.]